MDIWIERHYCFEKILCYVYFSRPNHAFNLHLHTIYCYICYICHTEPHTQEHSDITTPMMKEKADQRNNVDTVLFTLLCNTLILSCRRSLSYRKRSIDLQSFYMIRTSVLNYVPHVSLLLACHFCTWHACLHLCTWFTWFHFFTRLTCFYFFTYICPHFFTYLTCLQLFTCPTCLHFF